MIPAMTTTPGRDSLSRIDEDVALRSILEVTTPEIGTRFFESLVRSLSRALGMQGAWVTEYIPEGRRLRALAFWIDGRFIEWEAAIDGTPCERVIQEQRLVHIPDRAFALYPNDPGLRNMKACSYLGVPLKDAGGAIIGHLAVVDSRPLPQDERALSLFRIFADRAAAELSRLRAERELREREEKLARIFGGAMDAVIELDPDLRIEQVNPAAAKAFGWRAEGAIGFPFDRQLDAADADKLRSLLKELDRKPAGDRSAWIAGGLRSRRADGTPFPAEATVSAYESGGRRRYALILRNVQDRLDSEKKIESLTAEAEVLRKEIRELREIGDILGTSPPMQRMLEDLRQVADTDASVLILGETGTGKELVARALHDLSPRRSKPLIKVNCGAIPVALIESELFGHEKGAFTGASGRREGRFAMADGGTIFLDEVGEIPLDLQVKLLRVLQEGEFESVGGDKTRSVDVRVIAATNRDLEGMIREGTFRQDLYYRLNVFPLRVPPLRERGQDVELLARAFAERAGARLGRSLAPLSSEGAAKLRRYEWPGNVRELQNVIERAVITARGGSLNLDRALPEAAPAAPAEGGASRIFTISELEDLERRSIESALEAAGGKVSGPGGAAERLGVPASTLSSRLKALGIRRE
jgi:PAS domain S-box-containing protein